MIKIFTKMSDWKDSSLSLIFSANRKSITEMSLKCRYFQIKSVCRLGFKKLKTKEIMTFFHCFPFNEMLSSFMVAFMSWQLYHAQYHFCQSQHYCRMPPFESEKGHFIDVSSTLKLWFSDLFCAQFVSIISLTGLSDKDS